MADYVLKDHKPSLSARKPLRGWRVGYPCHLPERPGLIQPAGLTRPQCGLKPSLSARKPLRGWRVGYPCHIAGETWVDSARRSYPTSGKAYRD